MAVCKFCGAEVIVGERCEYCGRVAEYGYYPDLITHIKKARAISPPAPTGGKIWVVMAGDSLWTISKRVYGDPTKWRRIFEANRDQIKDENLIYPGQRLVIP